MKGESTMKIDQELSELIPALTEEEYKGLEASILSEGCRDALIVWGDILVDGHNRYKICQANNIAFKVEKKDFADRNEVKLWMLRNQLSRRNLNDFQRVEMVRKCEDAVKAEAKRRQGTRTDLSNIQENFPGSSQARDELGQLAGVSGKTYEHAVEVLDKAPEPVIEAARKKEISINAAYEVTKLPEAKQVEVSERIKQGETAKTVVADVKAELGAMANVSAKTYEKAVEVMEKAPEPIIEDLRKGNITINQAYQQVKKAERKAERQEAIAEQLSRPKSRNSIDIFTTEKKYRVIYADPAWSYNDKQDTK